MDGLIVIRIPASVGVLISSSGDETLAADRLTSAVLNQRQQAQAIIKRSSGTVVTGSTTEDLNAASLRAASGE